MDTRHERFIPTGLRDIIIRLEEWAQEQRLIDRASEQCRTDLGRCLAEQWEGWERLEGRDLETIELQFFRHTLTFQHGGLGPPTVTTELVLHFSPRGGDGPFGSYRFSVRLDGYVVGGFLIAFPAPPHPSGAPVAAGECGR